MKIWKLLAAVAAVGVFSFLLPVLPAQAGGEQPAPKAEEPKEEPKADEKDNFGENLKNMLKDLDQVTGKVEATEDDFKAVIKHKDSLEKVTDANEEFKKAKDKNMKEAFDIAIKDEKYIAWAKENGLEPEAFLRKFLRVLTIGMKHSMGKAFEDGQAQLDEDEKTIEQFKDALGEEEYKKQKESITHAKGQMKIADEAVKGIPGPTDAEKVLLDKYADQLELGMGGGSEPGSGGEEGGENGGKGN